MHNYTSRINYRNMTKYLFLLFLIYLSCSQNDPKATRKSKSDVINLNAQQSEKSSQADTLDPTMPKTVRPSFIDKSLKRLSFKEMMIRGIRPDFKFDFKIYNIDGQELGMEEVKRKLSNHKDIMEMFVNEFGDIKEAYIRPSMAEEIQIIMTLSNQFITKHDTSAIQY